MKLNRIRCQNFFSHYDTDLDFEKSGSPVLVTGDNGAGKSSAVSEALSYAFFGTVRVDSIDDVIRDQEDEMCVTIEFEMNGQEISITRRKRRGKSQKITMLINNESVSELATETQLRINKLVGLSYDSFRSSVILRQEDADFFVMQKPDDRKKIIAEILDLNAYEKLEKLARERRTEVKADIKAEQNVLNSIELEDLEDLQSDLEQVDEHLAKFSPKIAKAQEKLDKITAINAHLKEEIERHTKNLANHKTLERKIESYTLDCATKETELGSLQNVVDVGLKEALNLIEAEIDLKEHEINRKTQEVNIDESYHAVVIEEFVNKFRKSKIEPLQSEFAIQKSNLKTLTDNYSKAKEAGLKCDSCNRPFEDAAERTAYVDSLKKQILQASSEFDTTTQLLQENLNVLKTLERGQFNEALVVKERVKEFRINLNHEIDNLKELRKSFALNQERLRKFEVAQSRKTSLNEAIKTLKEAISDLQEQQSQIDTQPVIVDTSSFIDEEEPRIKLMELRNGEKTGLKIKSQLEQRIELGIKNNQRHTEITEGLNQKLHRLGLLEKLCIAFSRKGVPAAIIETVLPEIEKTANKYLEKMSEGSLTIRFNTTMTLKTGEQKETLEIEVFDGQNWRIFESFSGGEKFRVSLSLRLALSHILALRAGIDLELLILDEPASPLDPVGREIFVSTIKSLSNHFSRIILISHLSDLQEEFEYRINLSKSENATKVI